jgi:hypothetical protein
MQHTTSVMSQMVVANECANSKGEKKKKTPELTFGHSINAFVARHGHSVPEPRQTLTYDVGPFLKTRAHDQ